MKYLIILGSFLFVACASSNKPTSSAQTKSTTTTANTEIKKTDKIKPSALDKKAAAEKKSGEKSQIVCTFGSIKREINIINADDKCVVQYVKEGTAQEIANGAYLSSFCPEMANRVKNNLTSAGYKCE